MGIFEKLRDVQTSQKTIRIIVRTLIIAFVTVVIAMWVMMQQQINDATNSVYILTSQGDVLQANKTDQSTSRPIEAKAHVRQFIELFFSITKLNYIDNINRSFDLGGDILPVLYQKLDAEGWYTKITQYNVIQNVSIQSIEITSDVMPPYKITAVFFIKAETDAAEPQTIDVTINFEVRNGGGERNDKNPHNMMIDKLDIINWTLTN